MLPSGPISTSVRARDPFEFDMNFFFTNVRRTIRFEVNGIHGRKGPVTNKECITIMSGEFASVPAITPVGQPGPTSTTDPTVSGSRFSPFLGCRPPTTTSGYTVIYSSGTVPGCTNILFHVGIVDE